MIDFAALQLAFFDWAVAVTGLPVIWENENGPRPTTLYIGLRISTVSRVGRDFVGRPDSFGESIIVGNRELVVFARAFGDGSIEALESMVTSMERPIIQESLRAAGVACLEGMPVQNISGLYDTKFQERGAADFRFRTHSEITEVPEDVDEPQIIEVVEAEGTLERPPEPDLVHEFVIDGTP